MFFPNLSPAFEKTMAELTGKGVAILGHLRPDGDCIGSQVGLCRVLRDRGIDAVCVNPDSVPRRLIFTIEDTPFYPAEEFSEFDRTPVTTDCADETRIGPILRERYPEIFANVDHHISNTAYGDRNFIDIDAAATAEILAGMFLDLGWKIDRVTAQALFVGIATDTGQFRFPSTTRRVFSISGRLLDYGARPSDASLELYERERFSKMRLLQSYLSSLRMECDDQVCVGFLPQNVFDETGATSEDTEGLVDYARSIDEAKIAVFLEERPDGIKGSLRCKTSLYRVDQVAGEFGGGGHACAAGFNSNLSIDKLYPRLLEVLESHLRKVEKSTTPQ